MWFIYSIIRHIHLSGLLLEPRCPDNRGSTVPTGTVRVYLYRECLYKGAQRFGHYYTELKSCFVHAHLRPGCLAFISQLTPLQWWKSSINCSYTYYSTSSPSQDEEVVQLPRDPASGSVDLIDFDNPADLMLELLKQCGGSATISKLTKVCGG